MRIWPVIHVSNPEQALNNARVASEAGVYGVFLIQMEGQDEVLDPIATQIRQHFPQLKIGVNYLSLDPVSAVRRALAKQYDATWSDRPGVRSDAIASQAHEVSAYVLSNPDHRFFASVAFKYQPIDLDPPRAAQMAHELGFIPTTSGLATGAAPTCEKLEAIRLHLGDKSQAPFAVASGITPENVAQLGRGLTDILVSTGISSDFYTFDPELLQSLVRACPA